MMRAFCRSRCGSKERVCRCFRKCGAVRELEETMASALCTTKGMYILLRQGVNNCFPPLDIHMLLKGCSVICVGSHTDLQRDASRLRESMRSHSGDRHTVRGTLSNVRRRLRVTWLHYLRQSWKYSLTVAVSRTYAAKVDGSRMAAGTPTVVIRWIKHTVNGETRCLQLTCHSSVASYHMRNSPLTRLSSLHACVFLFQSYVRAVF